jgi:hypothetical protein
MITYLQDLLEDIDIINSEMHVLSSHIHDVKQEADKILIKNYLIIKDLERIMDAIKKEIE